MRTARSPLALWARTCRTSRGLAWVRHCGFARCACFDEISSCDGLHRIRWVNRVAAASGDSLGVLVIAAGVSRNYDESTEHTMPTVWEQVLPYTRPGLPWNMSAWVPHVVVINLGTNDFWAGLPDQAAFEVAYSGEGGTRTVADVVPCGLACMPSAAAAAVWLHPATCMTGTSDAGLLWRVRGFFPRAHVIMALGPMLWDQRLDAARRYLADVRLAAGDPDLHFLEFPQMVGLGLGVGCSGHPNQAVHRVLADALIEELKQVVGWD